MPIKFTRKSPNKSTQNEIKCFDSRPCLTITLKSWGYIKFKMIEAAQSQNMMCVAIHWPGATAGRQAGLGRRNKDNNNTVLKVVPDIIEASLARQTKTEDRPNIIWVMGENMKKKSVSLIWKIRNYFWVICILSRSSRAYKNYSSNWKCQTKPTL